jgi:hypothetical protein
VNPSIFICIRFVIKSRKYLRWSDALHLLPAVLYLVDFSPFSSVRPNINSPIYSHCWVTIKNGYCVMMTGGSCHRALIFSTDYHWFYLSLLRGKMLFKYYRSGVQNNKPYITLACYRHFFVFSFRIHESSFIGLCTDTSMAFSSICVMTFFL